MTIAPKIRLTAAAVSLALLAACGAEPASETEAVAAADEPEVIDQRQDNFESISDAFKVIRTQLESGEPDFTAIETSAADISERAQLVSGYFPEGTGVDDGYDTEALSTIWEDPAGFEKAAQNFVDASAEMVTVAASGDAVAVGEQVKTLGGTCKGCHDKFRLKTD
ncbi:c-type cytochrome [Erythrobacter sp. MTPC3]|uniref:c-type cytochrome n=1 Tax=Erythrobacter sp. MTPC3 TaxID=3056564 RepID=UPI0036F3F95C